MADQSIPSFGTLLRHYRLAARLTQEELAEMAGVSRLTISALERGARHVPRRDTVQRLAAALRLRDREIARLEVAARATAYPPFAASGDTALDVSALDSPPLVGRDAEIGILERHLDRGGPRLLVLAGEPGIGKTRLLTDTARYAAASGLRVLAVGCHRGQARAPYGVLAALLARHVRSLAPHPRSVVVRQYPWLTRLLPELAADLAGDLPSLPPDQERRLISDAVTEYLLTPEAHDGRGAIGTLLVIDDLQWADPDSLEMLGLLARHRLDGGPALRLVGAYRNTDLAAGDPLATLLADLIPGSLATQLSVGPLDPPDALHLLRELLPEGEQPILTSLVERSGGVPFFLVSFARAIRAGDAGLPLDLVHSIRSRTGALSAETREVLTAAAVLSEEVSYLLLSSMTGLPEESIALAVDEAERAGLLIEDGESRSRFPYPVIREVIARDIGSARRRLLRQRIARSATGWEGSTAG